LLSIERVTAVEAAVPTDGATRIAMGVEYDGSGFHGWQVQDEVRTVQCQVELAVGTVAGHQVRVHCAGRTDRGVHALGQVIHFDTRARRSERSWVLGTNVNLPADVGVLWAKPLSLDFHARFCATARHYLYLVVPRATRSPLMRNRAVWVHRMLDPDLMRRAAASLVGEHDFSSFRARGCQARSPVRCVHYASVEQRGQAIELRIGANGFLHHMVRNIAGVLMAIGCGDEPVSRMQELLQIRDRTRGGVTAPPQGLYFLGADYGKEFPIPRLEPRASPLTL
jgi:tRNA pseudouridine38-40 synthase